MGQSRSVPATPAPVWLSIAHEQSFIARARCGVDGGTPVGAWPTDTYFDEERAIFQWRIDRHRKSARRAYRRRLVRVFPEVGCGRRRRHLPDDELPPIVDTMRGGSINGIIDALNRVLDIAIPKDKQEGGTAWFPGTDACATRPMSLNTGIWPPLFATGSPTSSKRAHAPAGQSGEHGARLRRPIWFGHRFLDDRRVCDSGVQRPEQEEVVRNISIFNAVQCSAQI